MPEVTPALHCRSPWVRRCRFVRALGRFSRFALLVSFSAVIANPGPPASGQESEARNRPIVAAAVQGFSPYFVTEGGEAKGFAVDVMNELGRRIGLDVTYRVFASWDEALEAVRTGEVDLIPNVGISEARSALGHFTKPYQSSRVLLFVRQGAPPIVELDDMAGRTAGIVATSIARPLLTKYTQRPLRVFATYRGALQALLHGEVDFIAGPESVIEYFAHSLGERSEISQVGPPLARIERAFLVTAKRSDLLSQLDNALEDFAVSGRFEQIYRRWFEPASPSDLSSWRWMITTVLLLVWIVAIAWLWKARRTIYGNFADLGLQRVGQRLWIRVLATAGTVALVSIGSLAVMILVFYRAAFEHERNDLISRVEATRQMIETVARFNRRHSAFPGEPTTVTLMEIRDGLVGVSPDTEAVVGLLDGDGVQLLLRQKAARIDAPMSLPRQADRGEPIQRAVSGRSGWMIGNDYRGITVLAAYAPLPGLGPGFGLVIKQDLSALRAPFLIALWNVSLLALGLCLVGAVAYFSLTLPIVRDSLSTKKRVQEFARFVQDYPNPVLRIDRYGDVTVANPATQEFLNELSTEQSVEQAQHDRQAWRELLQYAQQARQRDQYEFVCRGHTYLVDIVPQAEDGTVDLYATDIQELRRTEAMLRLLHHAVEQSSSMVIITDPQGVIEYVNPKVCEVTGYTRDELLGQSPRIWQSGDTSDATYRELWTAITAGEAWSGELRNRHKDGTQYTVSASIAPVRAQDGQIENHIALEDDITERRSIEEQLRQSQKLETLGQLTGGIAHDFNNLLMVIMGNVQLIGRAVKNDARLAAMAASVVQATQRGTALTRRLLAFSRRQILESRTVMLNDAVRGMEEMLTRTLPENIKIHYRLADDLGPVWLDPGRLEDALLNLVVNARDAMPAGGVLTVETANTILDEAYAELNPGVTPGHYAMLAVSDSGIGMTRETLTRVFEPFFTTKEVGKGTGLGLSMVYGFTRQSGGHAKIYSEPGIGTTIKLYFPLSDEVVEHGKKVSKPPPESVGGNELILVVEDEVDVRTTVVGMLEHLGYRILQVGNGQEALQRLADHPDVDLVLTDVVMPGGMNGLELAQRIAREHPRLKLLYTSGFAEGVLHGRGQRLKEAEWLPKPYTEDQLASRLRELLDTEST